MKIKLYPADQLQRYLLIDIIVCILLFYQVLTAEGPFGFFGDLLLLGLFLILFYMGLWYRDWRLLLAVLGGCAFMAVLGIFYNEILLLFGIIFADFLGRARSKLYIFIGMIGFIVTYMVTNFYVHEDSLYFIHTPHLPMLIIQLVVPVVIHMLEGSKLLRRELASANERIDRYVQEEERQRLARDLHDTLGQTLTMIKVKSELAMRLLDKDPELARGEMQEVLHTSRSALKQVRDLVTSMKYVSLEEEFQLGRELLTSSGVQCKVSRSNDQPMLSKATETMLALAMREALTNIVKHSKAKQCIVTDQYTDGWYHICIEDDGIGMGEEKKDGHGLNSIQERMRLIGGEGTFSASSARGVRVTLSIPVDERREGEE